MSAKHKNSDTAGRRYPAIYARISDDRDGNRLGVGRQVADCTARAILDGHKQEAIRQYVDNSISATKRVRRPEYDRMLADMEAGLISPIYVYALDRLTRRPAELEQFMTLADKHDIRLVNIAGEVDLSTSSGRMVARIMGAVASQETDRLGERIQRKILQLVESGQPAGGRRLYGYRWVTGRGLVINQAEAKIVREIARRILAKESLHAIAGDLNDRGVPTASGDAWGVLLLRKILKNPQGPREQKLVEQVQAQQAAGRSDTEIVRDLNDRGVALTRSRLWSTNTIRSVMRSPAIAGLVTYHGKIVGKGTWRPILKRERWEDVNRELSAPERLVNTRGGVVRHLLSGLIRCEACGEPMVVKLGPRRVPRYSCDKHGCLKITIHQAGLDAHVIGLVLYRLGDRRYRAALEYGLGDESERVEDLHQEIGRLEALRAAEEEAYATQKAAGENVEADLAVATIKKVDRLLEDARTELAAITSRANLLGDIPPAPDPAWWEELPLGRKRALVEMTCGRMTVVRATKTGRGSFDPTRLRFDDDRGPARPPS